VALCRKSTADIAWSNLNQPSSITIIGPTIAEVAVHWGFAFSGGSLPRLLPQPPVTSTCVVRGTQAVGDEDT
jgi:hypothetical protein